MKDLPEITLNLAGEFVIARIQDGRAQIKKGDTWENVARLTLACGHSITGNELAQTIRRKHEAR